MGVATTVRDAANIKRANENETRREMIASWYITMPGIPSSEKEQLEKSLRYNLWASLIRFLAISLRKSSASSGVLMPASLYGHSPQATVTVSFASSFRIRRRDNPGLVRSIKPFLVSTTLAVSSIKGHVTVAVLRKKPGTPGLVPVSTVFKPQLKKASFDKVSGKWVTPVVIRPYAFY